MSIVQVKQFLVIHLIKYRITKGRDQVSAQSKVSIFGRWRTFTCYPISDNDQKTESSIRALHKHIAANHARLVKKYNQKYGKITVIGTVSNQQSKKLAQELKEHYNE